MAGLGLAPFADNSFLTHLATGRLILDLGHVPTVDTYTFTAPGASWVVQSWLVSLLFGAAEELAGDNGVRVVVGSLMVALFAIAWRLSRPAEGLLVRVGIGALVVGVGTQEWTERPLLVGLVILGCTVLAAEGDFDPRWLLPLGWIWVNSHGSFPLGLLYLVVVALGRRLDHLDASVELRCLRWLGGGILLGAVNPLGPELLLFPVRLLAHHDVLEGVVEWQAPTFAETGQRIFLAQVMLAVVAVVRRPRYRNGLVLAVFLAAAMLGARNIAVASLVLVPVLADAWPAGGRLRAASRDGLAWLLTAAGGIGAIVVVVVQLGQPAYALDAYPVVALDRLEAWDVDLGEVRLATVDRVGNLIAWRDGPEGHVFVDDRFELYPKRVSREVAALRQGGPSSTSVLDRWDIDLVLWPRTGALTSILRASPSWRSLDVSEGDWTLMCRRGAELGGALGTC